MTKKYFVLESTIFKDKYLLLVPNGGNSMFTIKNQQDQNIVIKFSSQMTY